MMASGRHNRDEAPAKKQKLSVWVERMIFGIYLEGKGSWVSKVVVLSSAINSKPVVLIGVSGLKRSFSWCWESPSLPLCRVEEAAAWAWTAPCAPGRAVWGSHQSSPSVCLLLALAGVTAEVHSPPSQLTEFKSSRLPCIPPSQPLFSFLFACSLNSCLTPHSAHMFCSQGLITFCTFR